MFYEFLCYLILGALAVLGLLRRRAVVLALAVSTWSSVFIGYVHPNLNNHYTYWAMLTLIPIFLTGSVLYLYREKVPDSNTSWRVLRWILDQSVASVRRDVDPLGTAIYAPQVLAPLLVRSSG